MHNIKDIRKDFENFKNKLKNRNIDISLDNIISLDEENRKLIQEKEKFEMEKKSISKSKDQSLFEKSKELSLKIEEINKNQIKLQVTPLKKDKVYHKHLNQRQIINATFL